MDKKAKEWLESFLYAFIILFILYFLCWPFKVDGDSMTSTLQPNDRIVVSRLITYFEKLDREDMVVCNVVIDEEKERVVKRIVGLPGDRVQIKDGRLMINGAACHEPYLDNPVTNGLTDITLAKDEYFILGDNRLISLDSRTVGPVKRTAIIGKVMAKWYPFSDFEVY